MRLNKKAPTCNAFGCVCALITLRECFALILGKDFCWATVCANQCEYMFDMRHSPSLTHTHNPRASCSRNYERHCARPHRALAAISITTLRRRIAHRHLSCHCPHRLRRIHRGSQRLSPCLRTLGLDRRPRSCVHLGCHSCHFFKVTHACTCFRPSPSMCLT